MPFDTPPSKPSIPVKAWKPHVPQEAIDDLKARLAASAPRARTWDNTNGPDHLGIKRTWIDDAIVYWKDKYDWRKTEQEIAEFPSFKGTAQFEGHTYDIHFLALYSERKDAVPIVFSHGWPGSVLEFIPMLRHLKKTYTPANLPYHILVPALVGYGFSSPPPLDRPFDARQNAGVFDALLQGLGFGRKNGKGTGYLAQGGDVGSFVTRHLSNFESCRGVHVNFFPLFNKEMDKSKLDESDLRNVERAKMWETWGLGYLIEHATKPATIGQVLESSPVAILAWIGEKLQFNGAADPMDFCLAECSLYWLTNSAATCLWQYRAGSGREITKESMPPKYISKPTGYSQFMYEIYPTPIQFIKERANVVWAKRHPEGGHFAALEKPVQLWNDVHEFAEIALKSESRAAKL